MLQISQTLKSLLITCGAAGLLLAILAPFETGALEFKYRLIYWIGLCFVGGFAVMAVDYIVKKSERSPKPIPLAFMHSAASATGVFAVLAGYGTLAGVKMNLIGALITFFYIWVVAIAISLVGMLAAGRKDIAELSSTERASLYDRLKPKLRDSKIYALNAEDHYVRVYTSKGEDLILMRLSDAIKEVSPLPGLSTHRSWWVSEAGVAKTGKKDIELHSGQLVPISRSGNKLVKEAGWT